MNVLNKKSAMAMLVAALSIALYGCKPESDVSAPAAAGAPAEADSAPSVAPHSPASVASGLEGFKAEQRGTLTCNLDTVSGQPASSALQLQKAADAVIGGWAFGAASADAPAAIVFSGPAGSFAAKVDVGGERPDVAKAYGAPQELNSGFNAVVDIRALPAGDYTLWFTRGEGTEQMACDLKAKVAVQG